MTINNRRSTAVLFSLLTVFFSGCLSLKPGTQKSGKSYYETFFVGEDGTQYYVKPLTFKEIDQKGELIVDMTFRYKDEVKDSASINFSILSPDIIKQVDSLIISNDSSNIAANSIKIMFNEKLKKNFKSRFSCKSEFKDLIELMKDENWRISVFYGQNNRTYSSTKKTSKKIKRLNDNVFIVF